MLGKMLSRRNGQRRLYRPRSEPALLKIVLWLQASTARGEFAPACRALASELASDKLYEIQESASTPYPREVPSVPAAYGSGLPAGRTNPQEILNRML